MRFRKKLLIRDLRGETWRDADDAGAEAARCDWLVDGRDSGGVSGGSGDLQQLMDALEKRIHVSEK